MTHVLAAAAKNSNIATAGYKSDYNKIPSFEGILLYIGLSVLYGPRTANTFGFCRTVRIGVGTGVTIVGVAGTGKTAAVFIFFTPHISLTRLVTVPAGIG